MTAYERTLSVTGVLGIAFLAQLAGHLLLKAYMPNTALGALGFLLIAALFTYVLFIRKDTFGFILIIYVCSHFSYADNQGGLWNLMTFGLLVLYVFFSKQEREIPQNDILVVTLLGIFVLWNVLGWSLNNPMPIVQKMQGVAVLFGFLMMFHLASNIIITKERFQFFLSITFFMTVYQFVVALIQKYYIIDWNTPLIGGYSDKGTVLTHAMSPPIGTLQHFELFGEYGVLVMCLMIPLLSARSTQNELNFGSYRVLITIILCLAIIMITSQRAPAILAVVVVVFYYFVLQTRIFAAIDRLSRQIWLVMAVILVIPVIGVYTGLDGLEEDFAQLKGTRFSLESVASGKAINRGSLTTIALKRIEHESWWAGFGYGVPRSNEWAWWGVDSKRGGSKISDFHNLYLSLPMLYGWVGAMAFIAIIILTQWRLFKVSLKFRQNINFLIVVALGFTLFWGIFLIDEFKISILRNPNYHMIFWIWLGLSNSITKTIRYNLEDGVSLVNSHSNTKTDNPL